jgi:hypothetical protein
LGSWIWIRSAAVTPPLAGRLFDDWIALGGLCCGSRRLADPAATNLQSRMPAWPLHPTEGWQIPALKFARPSGNMLDHDDPFASKMGCLKRRWFYP